MTDPLIIICYDVGIGLLLAMGSSSTVNIFHKGIVS